MPDEAWKQRDHLSGNVDPNNRAPTLGCTGGRIPRPCSNVEEPDTRAGIGRIQQLLDKAAGDSTQEVVVAGRLGVPPRHLERRERVWLDPAPPQLDRMPSVDRGTTKNHASSVVTPGSTGSRLGERPHVRRKKEHRAGSTFVLRLH